MTLARDLVHAGDCVAFAQDRLGFEPEPWQAQAMRSTSKQIALNVCRQAGKSTSTAIIALHTALFDPGLCLIAPRSLRQSRELFAKVASFLKQLEAPAVELEEDNRLSCTLRNGARIVSLPGDAATVRGFSSGPLRSGIRLPGRSPYRISALDPLNCFTFRETEVITAYQVLGEPFHMRLWINRRPSIWISRWG